MGGRIADLAVYEADPRIFYVGTAGGGVWKTENGGHTMTPIFDKQPVLAIGAVAVNQKNPDEVWVGTGEPSSRNSTDIGQGLYHSTDGGKTWTSVAGFENVRQFGKIAIDPNDPKTILVAALGNLWGPNPERGLYKSTDDGKTWKKVMDQGDKVGVVDVVYNPKNPKVVLAVTWERLRVPYNFYSRSVNNGIWRSTDGGEKWTRMTKGIPTGEVGRIGLDVMDSNPKIWVAEIDHKDEAGYYRSEDEGQSWTKISKQDDRPFYFSMPRQDPTDENRVYAPATSLMYSDDKGKTFKDMSGSIHPDFHAMWIDPKDHNHMLVGNDGGVAQTRDRGVSWEFLGTMRIGQFYAVDTDNRKPYWVYGGAQDNGCWGGPTQTRNGGVSYFHWISVGGGDGFYVKVDPEDWHIIYSESQGGAIQRINVETGEGRGIRPIPSRLGEPSGTRYRFNWDSPIFISPHNHTTLYFGGNKVFKSVDRGNNWKLVSPDLTTNDPEKEKPVVGDNIQSGAETHCTIICIGESPVKQGVLWVGTDDGNLQVSQDDGVTWKNVVSNVPGVPKNTWVTRVVPSKYKEGRCYVTFDGHRSNDYKPYVYVTEDFGATWKALTGIPDGNPCYAFAEGEQNEDLLFVGTEFGLYVSIDRGQSWTKYTTDSWPNVRVDDLKIQARDLDLVVATHGRSFWTVPIGALEQLTKTNRDKDAFLCQPRNIYFIGRMSGGGYTSFGEFVARNTQPGAPIFYNLKTEAKERVTISVVDAAGNEVGHMTGDRDAGLHTVSWSPRGRIGRVSGDFGVVLKIGDKEIARTSVRVESMITDTGYTQDSDDQEQTTSGDPDERTGGEREGAGG